MNTEINQKIIERLNLQDLEPIQQEAVLADIGETILRQIVLDIHDTLPVEKHAILKSSIEKSDLDSIYQILKESGIDYEEVMLKASESVISDLV